MAEPQRPGWYPAPDGSASEQWWNGASWSDSKRGVGGAALPGLPAYRATPPASAYGAEAPPPLPPTQPPYPTLATQTGGRAANVASSSSAVAIVLGVAGILFFAPLGVAGIVLGITALRRPGTVGTQRTLALAAIVTGVIAVVWGGIQLAFFIFAIGSDLS